MDYACEADAVLCVRALMQAIRQNSGHAALTRLTSSLCCEGKSYSCLAPGEPSLIASFQRPLDWIAPTFQNEMMRKYRAKRNLGPVHSGAGEAPSDLDDDSRLRNKMLKVVDEMKARKTWSAGPGDQPSAQLPAELRDWVRQARIPPEGLFYFLHSDDATCGGCGIPARYCGCGIIVVDACRQDLENLLY
jgi:hypothetical protein